ncbi:MAG: hypothetical protein ACI4PU_03360 [Intestinibacter sp.]
MICRKEEGNNMYLKKFKNGLSATIAILIMLIWIFPLTVAFADSSYGFQGKGGNTLKMNTYSDSISVIEETDKYYLNSIDTPLNSSNRIRFGITMTAGMNAFGDGSNFKKNCMPYIKIYDSRGRIELAEYDDGKGPLEYYYFDPSTKTIYIGVEKYVLPEDDYMLVFGPEVCGNNIDKNIGVPIKFKFSTYIGKPSDEEPKVPPGISQDPVEPEIPEGYQGKNGNGLRMMTYDFTVLKEADNYYLNSINDNINGEEDIVFGFTMSRGINHFDESGFKNNSMPHIKICDEDWNEVFADYDNGKGLLKYLDFDPETKIIYIGVDKEVLPEGDYTLIFGSDVCGNNTSKTLGVPVVYQFSVVYPSDNGDDPDNPEDPGESGGTEDPEDPGESGGSEEPEDPGDPGESGGSEEPEDPGESGGTEEPEDPGESGGSEEPEDPTDPGESGGSEEPEDPTEPGGTEEPVDPTDPGESEEPVDPEEPEDPTKQEDPKESVDPEEPKPEEPKDQEEPVDSDNIDDKNDNNKKEESIKEKESLTTEDLDSNVKLTELKTVNDNNKNNSSKNENSSQASKVKNYKVPKNISKVVSVKVPEIEAEKIDRFIIVLFLTMFLVGAIARSIKFYFDIK